MPRQKQIVRQSLLVEPDSPSMPALKLRKSVISRQEHPTAIIVRAERLHFPNCIPKCDQAARSKFETLDVLPQSQPVGHIVCVVATSNIMFKSLASQGNFIGNYLLEHDPYVVKRYGSRICRGLASRIYR